MSWENPITNWGQQGQTSPGVDDFNRMERNIDILGKYDRAPGYGTATGTNAKAITLSPAPGSYYDGLCFAFKNATQNTGAVTINVNGMGAKPIKKPNGNDLVAGNLKAGSVYTVRYNGTNFILQGSDSSGNATPEHVLAGKTFSNDTDTELTGTMPNRAGDTAALALSRNGTTIKLRASQGYRDGSDDNVTHTDANDIAENIKNGVTIRGLTGTLKVGVVTAGDDDLTGDLIFPDKTRTETSYTKEIEVRVDRAGTYRVSFVMASDSDVYYAYARIYVNGTPAGDEFKWRHETVSKLWTQDITVSQGDLIQLYVHAETGGIVRISEFRISMNIAAFLDIYEVTYLRPS